MEKEEYELVPLNPIRRLEKKLQELEASNKGSKTSSDFVDILKSNQEVVDNLVKANSDLVKKIDELTVSTNSLMEKIDSLVERIDVGGEAGESETASEKSSSEVSDRLEKLEKRMNSLLLSKVPNEKWQELKNRRVGHS